jgi:hypothetical protein
VLTEARVAAHLKAELVGVEGEGLVLIGDGEHATPIFETAVGVLLHRS